MDAADTVRSVIDSFSDHPFMAESSSDPGRKQRAEMARQLVGDAPRSLLERVGREMEQQHGL